MRESGGERINGVVRRVSGERDSVALDRVLDELRRRREGLHERRTRQRGALSLEPHERRGARVASAMRRSAAGH